MDEIASCSTPVEKTKKEIKLEEKLAKAIKCEKKKDEQTSGNYKI